MNINESVSGNNHRYNVSATQDKWTEEVERKYSGLGHLNGRRVEQIHGHVKQDLALTPIFNGAGPAAHQITSKDSSLSEKAAVIAHCGENTQNQLLLQVIASFSQETALKESNELVAILCDARGRLHVRRVPFKQIDQSFFIAQKLAQQKLHTLCMDCNKISYIYKLQELQMDELKHFYSLPIYENPLTGEKERISSFLKALDVQLHYISTLLEKMPETLHSEWIKEGLSWLFFEIRQTIDLQNLSYSHGEPDEKAKIDGRAHYQCLREKIEKGEGLYRRAKARFPYHNMLMPGRHRIGKSHLLLDPLKVISASLSADSVQTLSQAFSNESRWAFLQSHPKEYFKALCQELQGYQSVLEFSSSLKSRLQGCTYVDIGDLLKLKCIQNGASVTELIAFFKNVADLRAGSNVPATFFKLDLKDVLKTATTLKRLDLSGSKVRDEDLKNCAGINIQEINLSQTFIDGSCLSEEICATVRILHLSLCRNLKDEHVERLSSRHVEEVDFSYTNIDGSCLKANAFKTVRWLSLNECKKITDENLALLSSRELKEVILKATSINGSCLAADAFRMVEGMNLNRCENLTDEYLKKISSEVLEELYLANTAITGSCFIADAFKKVRGLHLGVCGNITDDHLEKLSSSVLEEIDLSGTNISGRCLSSAAFKTTRRLYASDCKKLADNHLREISSVVLEEIALAGTHIDGSCLSADAFTTIKHLYLQRCTHITDRYLRGLSSRVLVEIDLSWAHIDGSCLSAKAFKSMRRLVLDNCHNIKDRYLKRASSRVLEEINLASTNINGSCLSADAFKNVLWLNVSSCEKVTDNNLRAFSSRSLRRVNLSWTHINGSCLSADAFATVEWLNVNNCDRLTDEHMKRLSSSVLEEAFLAWTNMNGSCLSSGVFKTVRRLFLNGCKHITDYYLRALSSISLEEIHLAWTPVDGSFIFGSAFKGVTTINVNNCSNIKSEYLKKLGVKKFKGLSQINL